MKRDTWQDWRKQRQSYKSRQELELVQGQRRRLEAMLQRQNRLERSESFDQLLSAPEPGSAELEALRELMAQAPEAELKKLRARLGAELLNRYGGRRFAPPLPRPLTDLLGLLASHAKAPREGGRPAEIRLEGLEIEGLRLPALSLRGLSLINCRLEAAELPELDLFAARLEKVSLAGARLPRANLTGSTLRQVELSGASLRGAELISAELEGCDLSRADLSAANLRGLRLHACDLRGANLAGVSGLTYQQLLSNRIDEQTVLPESLSHRREDLLARA